MSVALPVFFAFAAFAAIWSAWRAIAHNLPEIRELRRQLKTGASHGGVSVCFRAIDHVMEPMPVQRVRQRRVTQPKPVTHRLHHFAQASAVA